jgi:hypothetical protein
MRFRLPLALLAAALLALAAAGSASAAPGLEVAVQDDGHLLSDDPGSRAAALGAAASLGAVYVRANVFWASTAPSPTARRAPAAPVYDFTRYDRLIDEAAARGLRVQLTLTGPAPAWASGAHKVGVDRPDAKRFGAFVAQAAAHFRGRVTRYSVWNEPNWHGWLRPEKICRRGRCTKSAAARYRSLYVAAYAAVKRADPAAQVWIGETSPNRQGLPRNAEGRRLRAPPLRVLPRAELARPEPGQRHDRHAEPPAQRALEAIAGPRPALHRVGHDAGLPDRVRVLHERIACAVAGQARRLHEAGVRARAEGAGRPPAPLLPADRPARGRAMALGPDGPGRPAAPGVRRGAGLRDPERAAPRAEGLAVSPRQS